MAEDSDILFSIKRNAETGFRMLMSIYREPVYWHIRRMVIHHADAQDATQETFIRVFRSISGFRGESSLKVWIYRIATNEAMRQMGKNHPGHLSMDDVGSEVRQITAEEYVNYEDAEAVKFQNAILSLPPKQQLAFNMRYYDEMDYDEIAKVIGSTMSSVKASYHIAKEKIIKYMSE